MKIIETLDKLKIKYGLDFDTFYYRKTDKEEISYYWLAQDIISEKKFLDELISRNKRGFASYKVRPYLFSYHWDIFSDHIDFYLSSSSYEKELQGLFCLISFLDCYFYVDDTWDKDKALLLEKLLVDEDLKGLINYWLGFDTKTVLRESSYCYKNEVWDIVKKYFRGGLK